MTAKKSTSSSELFWVYKTSMGNVCSVIPEGGSPVGNKHLGPFATRQAAVEAMCRDVDATISDLNRCWSVTPIDACKLPQRLARLPNADAPKDLERVAQLTAVVSSCISIVDHTGAIDPHKSLFLHRVAWHESLRLMHRTQIGGGPGRGIYMFEPDRATETVVYAIKMNKSWWAALCDVGGCNAGDLEESTKRIAASKKWGTNELLETLLLTNDHFTTLLARIAFWMISAPINSSDLDFHTQYWLDHWWRGTGPNDPNRPVRKKAFLASAADFKKVTGVLVSMLTGAPSPKRKKPVGTRNGAGKPRSRARASKR
ncbi:hypothetical protein LBMAG48_28830 [Phycisphaerae bacterium]|nr:hypothetical protein LBMAG48_28830 [Phycisphaerae bacterium]